MALSRLILKPEFLIKNEIPTGNIDGQNLSFQTQNSFMSGSLEVFLDGRRLESGKDFTTTNDNTFDLIIGSEINRLSRPPKCNEEMSVNYIRKCL